MSKVKNLQARMRKIEEEVSVSRYGLREEILYVNEQVTANKALILENRKISDYRYKTLSYVIRGLTETIVTTGFSWSVDDTYAEDGAAHDVTYMYPRGNFYKSRTRSFEYGTYREDQMFGRSITMDYTGGNRDIDVGWKAYCDTAVENITLYDLGVGSAGRDMIISGLKYTLVDDPNWKFNVTMQVLHKLNTKTGTDPYVPSGEISRITAMVRRAAYTIDHAVPKKTGSSDANSDMIINEGLWFSSNDHTTASTDGALCCILSVENDVDIILDDDKFRPTIVRAIGLTEAVYYVSFLVKFQVAISNIPCVAPRPRTSPLYIINTHVDRGTLATWFGSKEVTISNGESIAGPAFTIDGDAFITGFTYSNLNPLQGSWNKLDFSIMHKEAHTVLTELYAEVARLESEIEELKEVIKKIIVSIKKTVEVDSLHTGINVVFTFIDALSTLIPGLGSIISNTVKIVAEEIMNGVKDAVLGEKLGAINHLIEGFMNHFIKFVNTKIDEIDFDDLVSKVPGYLYELYERFVSLIDDKSNRLSHNYVEYRYIGQVNPLLAQAGYMLDHVPTHAYLVISCYDNDQNHHLIEVSAGDFISFASSIGIIPKSQISQIKFREITEATGTLSHKTINTKSYEQIVAFINSAKKNFNYNILAENCQHFAHALQRFCSFGTIPSYVKEDDLVIVL